MIWYLIGWIVLGFIFGALTGVIGMWVVDRLGYDDIVWDYAMTFFVEREAKCINEKTSWWFAIGLGIFNSIFWPVKLIRLIFLDIPDGIEFYKNHHNKEEQA